MSSQVLEVQSTATTNAGVPLFMETRTERKLLRYTNVAIRKFNMIQKGDRVLVCVSGGKDSYTMLSLLNILRVRSHHKFYIKAFILDQGQPGWADKAMRDYLDATGIDYTIVNKDTYSIVKEKIPENKTYCGLCSRLRRGIIYRYAREEGFNKVALGHHRDDVIESYLMSIFYNGLTKTMPPKLLTDSKDLILIRPLTLCQENDIMKYAKERAYPIIPCNLCGSQENLARQRTKMLLKQLAKENPKIPSNILHACANVRPSQLHDSALWPFQSLESELIE